MKHACLVPDTHHEDLTNAMAMLLRVRGMTFEGGVDAVETRAFDLLWSPSNAFTYSEIRPRLAAAIAAAREESIPA